MKKNNIVNTLRAAMLTLALGCLTACVNDLDRFPTNDVTSEVAYKDLDGYKQVLAKVYGAYALTGQEGPAGDKTGDVLGLDEGSNSDFFRCFWNAQVLTTDEAICAWGDAGIPELNFLNFTASNPFTKGLYYRSIFQISMVNEFLRQSTDGKLSERGISDVATVHQFRAEVRFLRAYQYWVLMDLYGNPPFVDETTPMGKYLPEQISRADLFNYIEKELLDISADAGNLAAPRANEYGRVDKGAVYALLARLYLNAKIYTGTERYTDAITYASKVIAAGYDLKANYPELFMADNNVNNPEVILSINYDGQHTQSYGGLHFIINASFKGERDDDKNTPKVNYNTFFGNNSGGWGGNRVRKELYDLFDAADGRRLFVGEKASVDNVSNFEDGMMQIKFRNVTSTGGVGSNVAQGFTDVDMPIFRLAEQYLIYAEAVLRGGAGGSLPAAIQYINELRERAYGNTTGKVDAIDLDFILAERGRELYWEGHRRTDLIRYDQFTSSNYLWQWKGGVQTGRLVDDHYKLFPLPAADLVANPNLKQNTGYSSED
ncbi:MAG: RagB/SusD family nutrient uptake outer membrane protein [Candidatus Symbiothrix sp.]|jgi:hypothetical protein|nr:RagB/SusD family nutrient uptake outer membrane protein [Candidatus Symbiothrix sp.]